MFHDNVDEPTHCCFAVIQKINISTDKQSSVRIPYHQTPRILLYKAEKPSVPLTVMPISQLCQQ